MWLKTFCLGMCLTIFQYSYIISIASATVVKESKIYYQVTGKTKDDITKSLNEEAKKQGLVDERGNVFYGHTNWQITKNEWNLPKDGKIWKIEQVGNQYKATEPLAKVFHITLHYGSISVLYQTFQVLGGL